MEESLMEQGQRLVERLSSLEDYSPDDIGWYHFVRDHKQYLRRNSSIARYMPEDLVKYRYKPWEFVKDKMKVPGQAAWIFLFINDIRDPHDFNESHTKLRQFTKQTLDHMYQIYSTSASHT